MICAASTVTVVLAAAAVTGPGCGCQGRPRHAAPAGAVTAAGRTWQVELVTDPGAQSVGLAYRDSLPTDRGMLFAFPQSRPRTFHMLNCRFPIDIAFLDANRRVVRTHTMAVEPRGQAERKYRSGAPARYALEVNAGQLAEAGVKTGTEVRFSPELDARIKAAFPAGR